MARDLEQHYLALRYILPTTDQLVPSDCTIHRIRDSTTGVPSVDNLPQNYKGHNHRLQLYVT